MELIKGQLPNSTTSPSPEINFYPPTSTTNNHKAIIIFPGGGYHHLAEHEGKGYAEYFNTLGYTCFVVMYRLASNGDKHPAMLEDALSAIYTIRKNATHYKINPNKIGVMGSSAGGHLAAHCLTQKDYHDPDISLTPDFGILCYPVILSQGEFVHQGSIRSLLGDQPSKDLLNKISCDLQVDSKTPPCFIWHTYEDTSVPLENSLEFAKNLRKNKIPFELHLYEKGGHGLGLKAEFNWAEDCHRWLKRF